MRTSTAVFGCVAACGSLVVVACSIGPSPLPSWAQAAAASATGPVVLPTPPDAEPPTPAMDAAVRTDTGTTAADATLESSVDASADASGDAALGEGGEASMAETWTDFYTAYLAPGTVGDCKSCHAQADSAPDTFTYLETSYTPTDFAMAFTWSGGTMPLNGPKSEPAAVAALNAWIAAGAQNN